MMRARYAMLSFLGRQSKPGFLNVAARLGVGHWSTDEVGRLSGHLIHVDNRESSSIDAFLRSVHPEDRQVFAKAAADAVSGDGVMCLSFRTDGRPVKYLRIGALVERAAPGRLALTTGLLFDETEHVTAQARFDAIAQSSPATLWMMEPDGFVSFFSQGWHDLTGQPTEEALGLGWLKRLHPDDLDLARDCAKQAVAQQTFFRIEHRIKHCSGQWRWVMCVGNPRFSLSGTFLGHSGTVIDIHARRQLEKAYSAQFTVGRS